MKRKPKHRAQCPTYEALSRALDKCRPLAFRVTVRLPLEQFVALRSELITQSRWRRRAWGRFPFDTRELNLELWGSEVTVLPR